MEGGHSSEVPVARESPAGLSLANKTPKDYKVTVVQQPERISSRAMSSYFNCRRAPILCKGASLIPR